MAAHAETNVLRGGMQRRKSGGEKILPAIFNYLRRSPDAFGGYIAHCGLALMFIGFAASSGYQIERTDQVKKGETFYQVIDPKPAVTPPEKPQPAKK